MKTKILAAAVAAVMAAGSLGAATAASAQARPGHAAQSRAPSHAQSHARTPSRAPAARPAPQRVQPAPAAARWRQAERRYTAPRYVAPRGHAVRTWSYGQRMPVAYRTQTYVVSDYGRYGLRAPPAGYQYVRSGNDVVLTAVATGLIAAVIAGLFN